jgi:hypothetical protein
MALPGCSRISTSTTTERRGVTSKHLSTPTIDADAAAGILRKACITGGLRRIPRHPEHRDVVLALLCASMQRRHPYREIEINEYLKARLAGVRATVDHVTCRRYLVDLGFVKRDRAGLRYFLNFPRLEEVLAPGALTCGDDLLSQCLPPVGSRSGDAETASR